MLAVAFPGQGAHEPRMVESVKGLEGFETRYGLVCDLVGLDILREVERGNGEILNRNLYSSLLTVLVSSISLDAFRVLHNPTIQRVAGYSVGQWTAMYAAGMIGYEQLVTIVAERSRLMDECTQATPGAMCAVIGVPLSRLEELLGDLQAEDLSLFIANYNCSGQYSISGTVPAVAIAEERIRGLNPKKVMRLPVSGAWHCPLLAPAERKFLDYLDGVSFHVPQVPVMDNVSGERLPEDETQLRQSLARHLSHSVQWERNVKALVRDGCKRIVEIGYGNVLAKFGFFIDRRVEFSSFCA